MMKKLTALTVSAVMAATLFTSCGVPENTVHSIDDLKGKPSEFSSAQQEIFLQKM